LAVNTRTVVAALVVVAALGAVAATVLEDGTDGAGPSPCSDVPRPTVDLSNGSLDRVEVWLSAPNGTVLARLGALIAASPESRRIGLRETDRLTDDEGMIFVHGSEADWSYGVEGVGYPLDIVFARSGGEITTIHHAPPPDELDPDRRFSGRGQYVLQVPRGYTNRTGVAVGDCLAIPAGLRNAA
jgi:uncharacterized membrane protein (UPF0127 family)